MDSKAHLAFSVEGVSFSYHGKQQALLDVSLDVAIGEQLVILGANGCGKSTFLQLLDGLHAPTAGRLWAFGEDVTGAAEDQDRARALHRRVGLVFQDPDIQLFCPTVYDDVAFGPLQLGWSETEVRARVDRELARMSITHLSDRAPYELSGGEKKRVAIASVLSMDPDVILLDEPTASLDPRSKSVLVDIIVGLRALGKTTIVATHELDIVPIIATRVVVFGDRERRPVAGGPPEEILADEELLLRTNLIHEHLHHHGSVAHAHPHWHDPDHVHDESVAH